MIKFLSFGSSDSDQSSLDISQDTFLNKLCPLFCLHYPYFSLSELKNEDDSSLNPFHWIDDPFSLTKFEIVLSSCKKNPHP